MKDKLNINEERIKAINHFFLKDTNPVIENVLDVIKKYGTVDEINRKAKEAARLENKQDQLKKINSPYLKDLFILIHKDVVICCSFNAQSRVIAFLEGSVFHRNEIRSLLSQRFYMIIYILFRYVYIPLLYFQFFQIWEYDLRLYVDSNFKA